MDTSVTTEYKIGGVVMKYSIDEILDMLSSDDEKIQEKGINIGSEVKNLKCFIMPIYGDPFYSAWENCAKIVCRRSDNELRYYFNELLIWISDMSTPGASQIFERLVQYEDKNFLEWALNASSNKNLRESMRYELGELINEANLSIEI